MSNNGFIGELNDWLGDREGKRAESGSVTSDKDQGFHDLL